MMEYMNVQEILRDEVNPSVLVGRLVNYARDREKISDKSEKWWRQLLDLVPEIDKDVILQLVAENADRLNGSLPPQPAKAVRMTSPVRPG